MELPVHGHVGAEVHVRLRISCPHIPHVSLHIALVQAVHDCEQGAGVTGPGPGVGPVPLVELGILHTNLPPSDTRTDGGQQFGLGKRQGVGGHAESDIIVDGPVHEDKQEAGPVHIRDME